jgi:hypothetical protein
MCIKMCLICCLWTISEGVTVKFRQFMIGPVMEGLKVVRTVNRTSYPTFHIALDAFTCRSCIIDPKHYGLEKAALEGQGSFQP